jgi:hypothetical protein
MKLMHVLTIAAFAFIIYLFVTSAPQREGTYKSAAASEPSAFERAISDWRPEYPEVAKDRGPVKDAPDALSSEMITGPTFGVQALIELEKAHRENAELKAKLAKALEPPPKVAQQPTQAAPACHVDDLPASRSERLLNGAPERPAIKITGVEKFDLPSRDWTGGVIVGEPGCVWCKQEKRDLTAAGYTVGDKPSDDFRYIVIRSKAEADARKIRLFPTTVFVRKGLEVERTVGYDGTKKRLAQILRHFPDEKRRPLAGKSSLYKTANYQQFAEIDPPKPAPAPGVMGDALDDDVPPAQAPSCATPKAAPSCSAPQALSAPPQAYTEIRSCATPDHPVIGYAAAPSCSQPSSYAAPVVTYSAPVTYSYAMPTYSYSGGDCGSSGGGGSVLAPMSYDYSGYGVRSYGGGNGWGGGYRGGWGGGYGANCPNGMCPAQLSW